MSQSLYIKLRAIMILLRLYILWLEVSVALSLLISNQIFINQYVIIFLNFFSLMTFG